MDNGKLWDTVEGGNAQKIVKNVGYSPPRGKTNLVQIIEFVQNFTLRVDTILKFKLYRKRLRKPHDWLNKIKNK